ASTPRQPGQSGAGLRAPGIARQRRAVPRGGELALAQEFAESAEPDTDPWVERSSGRLVTEVRHADDRPLQLGRPGAVAVGLVPEARGGGGGAAAGTPGGVGGGGGPGPDGGRRPPCRAAPGTGRSGPAAPADPGGSGRRRGRRRRWRENGPTRPVTRRPGPG